jgi:hypothetical protein
MGDVLQASSREEPVDSDPSASQREPLPVAAPPRPDRAESTRAPARSEGVNSRRSNSVPDARSDPVRHRNRRSLESARGALGSSFATRPRIGCIRRDTRWLAPSRRRAGLSSRYPALGQSPTLHLGFVPFAPRFSRVSPRWAVLHTATVVPSPFGRLAVEGLATRRRNRVRVRSSARFDCQTIGTDADTSRGSGWSQPRSPGSLRRPSGTRTDRGADSNVWRFRRRCPGPVNPFGRTGSRPRPGVRPTWDRGLAPGWGPRTLSVERGRGLAPQWGPRGETENETERSGVVAQRCGTRTRG